MIFIWWDLRAWDLSVFGCRIWLPYFIGIVIGVTIMLTCVCFFLALKLELDELEEWYKKF
jgi:lipid-A-disaccharide synthase-like uncharacterized protein